MAIKELYINNQLVDVLPGTFTYTLQVNDFFDLQTRQSNYSENIKLPKTAHNANIFQLAGAHPNNARIPYQKIKTDYNVGGIPVVYNAWGFLRQVDDSYNFYFIDGNIDLYRAIENLKLTDLPFDEFIHVKNIEGVKNTWGNDLPYVYAVADYGGIPEWQNAINIDFLVPSISLEWIWNKIPEITGFQFQISPGILENKWFTISDAYKDVSAEGTFDTAYDETEYAIARVNQFHQRSGMYIGKIYHGDDWTNAVELKFNADNNGYYDFKFITETAYPVFYPFPWNIPMPKIALKIGDNIIPGSTRRFTLNEDGTAFSINASWQNIQLEAGQSVSLVAVNSVESVLHYITSSQSITGSQTQVQFIYKPEAQVSLPEYLSDLPLKDLFQEILIQNALTPIVNKQGVYRFFTLNERLNAPVIDWSHKPIQFLNEKYKLGKFARNNIFKYKYNEGGENHNDGTITIPNMQLAETENIESKFYGAERTSTYFNVLNAYLPEFKLWQEEIKENNGETEIEYKELKNHYHWLSLNELSGSFPVKSKGYATSGTTPKIKVASFDQFKWQAIVDSAYSNIGKVVNEMKLYEFLIPLSPLEIQDFDFFCRIYHADLGAVFIPNRIKYESEDLSVVELIKITDV